MALKQLGEITDRLTALDDKARGGRIEADDWNGLVGAVQVLVAVSRAREESLEPTLEARFATADHGHLGEVAADWLGPGVLEQLTGAGGVDQRAQLKALERKVDTLSRDVARLIELAETQRREVDRFTVDNFDIKARLREEDDRLSVVDGLSATVGDLSRSVTILRGSFDEVLSLRDRLTDTNGEPIDVAALRQEVTGLSVLRTNLEGVDGNLVRLRDIEIQLRDLRDIAGVDGGGRLDDRLGQLRREVTAETETLLATELDGRDAIIAGTIDERIAGVNTSLHARFSAFGEERDAVLTLREAALEERLTASLDQRIAGNNETFSASLSTRIDAGIDARLESLPAQINIAVQAAVAPIELRITTELQNRFDRQLSDGLADFEDRQAARFAAFEGTLAAIQRDIPEQIDDAVAAERDGLQAFIAQRIEAEVPRMTTQVLNQLTGQVQDLVNSELTELSRELEGRIDERFVELDRRIDNAIDERLGDLDGRIATEVRARLGETDLDRRLTDLETRLTGTINGRISQAEARLRAERSTELSRTVATLRAEIDRARLSAVREATRTSGNDITILRNDIDGTLDARLRETVSVMETRIDRSLSEASGAAPVSPRGRTRRTGGSRSGRKSRPRRG